MKTLENSRKESNTKSKKGDRNQENQLFHESSAEIEEFERRYNFFDTHKKIIEVVQGRNNCIISLRTKNETWNNGVGRRAREGKYSMKYRKQSLLLRLKKQLVLI